MAKYPPILIPDTLSFGALQLNRDPSSGDIEFNYEPLITIARANGFTAEDLTEDFIYHVLLAWHMAHVNAGGEAHPVVQQLLAEMEAEVEFGEAIVIASPGNIH